MEAALGGQCLLTHKPGLPLLFGASGKHAAVAGGGIPVGYLWAGKELGGLSKNQAHPELSAVMLEPTPCLPARLSLLPWGRKSISVNRGETSMHL